LTISEKLRPPKPTEDPRDEYRWRYRVFELLNNPNYPNLTAYANNAAAVAGGLAVGDFYRTGGDPDLVAVVHE